MTRWPASSFIIYSLVFHLTIVGLLAYFSIKEKNTSETMLNAQIVFEKPSSKNSRGTDEKGVKKPLLKGLTAPVIKPEKPLSKISEPDKSSKLSPLVRPELSNSLKTKSSQKSKPAVTDQKVLPKENLPGFLRKNDKMSSEKFVPRKLNGEGSKEFDKGLKDNTKSDESEGLKPEQVNSISKDQTDSSGDIDQTGDSAVSGNGMLKNFWKGAQDKRSYRNNLAHLVRANWKLPAAMKTDFEIIVVALINPEGNLVSLKIEKSSKIGALDAAAERAVRVSLPFPQFPTSFPKGQNFEQKFRFSSGSVSFE